MESKVEIINELPPISGVDVNNRPLKRYNQVSRKLAEELGAILDDDAIVTYRLTHNTKAQKKDSNEVVTKMNSLHILPNEETIYDPYLQKHVPIAYCVDDSNTQVDSMAYINHLAFRSQLSGTITLMGSNPLHKKINFRFALSNQNKRPYQVGEVYFERLDPKKSVKQRAEERARRMKWEGHINTLEAVEIESRLSSLSIAFEPNDSLEVKKFLLSEFIQDPKNMERFELYADNAMNHLFRTIRNSEFFHILKIDYSRNGWAFNTDNRIFCQFNIGEDPYVALAGLLKAPNNVYLTKIKELLAPYQKEEKPQVQMAQIAEQENKVQKAPVVRNTKKKTVKK